VPGQVAPHLNRLINHLHGLAVGGLHMLEKRALAGSNIALYINLYDGGIRNQVWLTNKIMEKII